MKSTFSSTWKGSKQPRKQRKYRYNAPAHIKKKFVSVTLSKELRTKYKKRNVTVVKGDKVKVLRGQYKGKIGEVERVDMRNTKIIIQGVENTRKDGTKTPYPTNPSNLMITELKIEDKKRKASIEGK
jgi:large subunit ribosomal protein L24